MFDHLLDDFSSLFADLLIDLLIFVIVCCFCWLVGLLIGWLAGWLAAWLVGRSAGLLDYCFVGCGFVSLPVLWSRELTATTTAKKSSEIQLSNSRYAPVNLKM